MGLSVVNPRKVSPNPSPVSEIKT